MKNVLAQDTCTRVRLSFYMGSTWPPQTLRGAMASAPGRCPAIQCLVVVVVVKGGMAFICYLESVPRARGLAGRVAKGLVA